MMEMEHFWDKSSSFNLCSWRNHYWNIFSENMRWFSDKAYSLNGTHQNISVSLFLHSTVGLWGFSQSVWWMNWICQNIFVPLLPRSTINVSFKITFLFLHSYIHQIMSWWNLRKRIYSWSLAWSSLWHEMSDWWIVTVTVNFDEGQILSPCYRIRINFLFSSYLPPESNERQSGLSQKPLSSPHLMVRYRKPFLFVAIIIIFFDILTQPGT